MARRTKPTLQSLDYSGDNVPQWVQERRTTNSVENRESRALAAIAALEEQGNVLSDEQKLDILNQVVRTGNFTVADTPENDFSAVVDNAVVLPQGEEAPLTGARRVGEALGHIAMPFQSQGGRAAITNFFVNREIGNQQEKLTDLEVEARGLSEDRAVVSPTSRMATEYGMNTTPVVPLSPVEYAARRENLQPQIDAITGSLKALKNRASGLEEVIGPTAARVSRVVGQAASLEQIAPIVAGTAGAAVGGYFTGGLGAGVTATGAATVASIPMAKDVYDEARVEAAKLIDPDGTRPLTDEEMSDVNAYAAAITSIEMGTEVAGAALGGTLTLGRRFLGNAAGGATRSVAQRELANRIASRKSVGRRFAEGQAAEQVSEQAANIGTMGFDELALRSGMFESEDTNTRLREKIKEDRETFGETALDTAIATLGISGPAQGPAAMFSATADRNARTRDTADNIRRNLGNNLAPPPVLPETSPTPPVEVEQEATTIPDVDPAQREAEIEAAYQERERELNRERMRDSIVRRVDTARQNVEALQDRVDDGDTSQGTLNSLASAVRDQREAEATLNNWDVETAEQFPEKELVLTPRQEEVAAAPEPAAPVVVPEVQARREALRKKQEAEQKKLATNQRRADTIRRNTVTDTVIQNNPEASDTEIQRMVEEQLAIPVESAAPVAEPPVPAGMTRLYHGSATHGRVDGDAWFSTQRDYARGYRRGGQLQYVDMPTAWVNEQADPDGYGQTPDKGVIFNVELNSDVTGVRNIVGQQATPTVAPPTQPRRTRNTKKHTTAVPVAQLEASSDPDDQRAAAVMKLIGDTLGMSTEQTASTPVPADFNDKVVAISTALATDSSRESAAVEQLISDGRLIVAPNAASIGRTDDKLAASYDTATGTMYVYTDKMGDNVLADMMRAVPHEGTHLGQGQERDGRSQAMQALLGSEGPATLRQLAAQGHTGARKALERAEADTKRRRDDGEANPARYEDVELAAYFVGDLRGRSPGRARGAVNSMLASARSVMRERLGVPLNINLTDLEAAARGVVEEAAVTPRLTRDTLNPETLGMIYNQNSRGFDEALEAGYVYDSVDGRRKYVLSDEDALIRSGAADRVAQSNEPIPVSEILNHEVLYREHPEAANIPVYAADDLGNGVYAFYDPTDKEFWVRRDIANATNAMPDAPTFKGALMHEMQHYVQDEGGYSSEFFDGGAVSQGVQDATAALGEADATLNTAARTFLDGVMRTIPAQADKNIVMRDIRRPASSDAEMASRVRDTVQSMENVTPEAQNLIDGYEAARAQRNAAVRQLTDARNEQHSNYLRNITEREAHFTQYQTEASQMGMEDNSTGINPEPLMRQQEADPDTGADPTQGAIDVPVDGPEGRQVQARSQTSTPAFNRWFGDSKVVDENGNPRVMYHGTRSDFDTFSRSVDSDLGQGYYFTPDPDTAQAWATRDVTQNDDGTFDRPTEGLNIMPVYLSIQNPASYTDVRRAERNLGDNYSAEGVTQALTEQGFDGVIDTRGGEYVAFNPEQIKSATGNSTFDPANPSVLGMAATPTQENQSTPFRNRRFGTTILSLLRNDKGLGKAVRDAVELASPFVAPIEAKANQYVGEYQNALNRMAVESGKTYAQLNNEIRDALAEIQDLEGGPSAYKAAFNEVAGRYGKAGEALRNLRNLNDDLSRAIIDTYLNRGGKLTKAEAAELQAVVNNLGRYTHRFYASRVAGDAGKTYRDNVWGVIQKHKKGKKLTPREKEVYDTYSRAAKVLLEDMYIPDAEGLNKLKQERLDYLYGTWATDKDAEASREDKIAALEDKRNKITAKEMERQLEITSEALLFPFKDSSPVSTFYNRGAKRDNTIMKKRESIPKEIRDFMGEITDPMGALMVTASKQAEWVARTNMFLELQREADANDLQPPGSARSGAVRVNNMQELKGSEFGPMEGWYASPAMVAMIDGTRESLMTLTDALTVGQQHDKFLPKAAVKLANLWGKGASTAKYTSVVLSLVRLGYNGAGSLTMPAFNGNFDFTTYARGLQDAGNLIAYAANPKRGLRSAEDVVRFGVSDSATVGDLKSLDRPFLNDLVRELSGKDSRSVLRIMGKYVGSGKMLLREFYAMADVWAKFANFHYEVKHLTALYKDAGIEKTENEIKREASTIVNDTNIGWVRTAPVVKALERGGVSMFGAYMYDTFRIQATNMLQGAAEVRRAADMPTEKAKQRAAIRGMARLGGQAGYLAGWYYGSRILAGIFGDDEEKKREVGLHDGAKYDDYVNVGIGEDGKARLFRFSDLDPIGPSTNLMRAARVGSSWEDVGKAFLSAYIAPSLAGSLGTAVVQTYKDATGAKNEYVKTPVVEEWFADNFYNKMLDSAESWGVKPDTVRAWNNVAETIGMPGTMRAWTKSNLTPLTPASPEVFDTAASNIYSAMRYAGARASTYDPKIGGRAARETYTNAVANARSGMADYIKRTPDPTPEEVLGKATEYVRQEKEAWDKVNRMYEGMLALGMDDGEINEALGDGFPSLPKATLNQVKSGEFTSALFNESSFKQRASSSIKRARTEREKEELTERWENAWEILQLYKGDY